MLAPASIYSYTIIQSTKCESERERFEEAGICQEQTQMEEFGNLSNSSDMAKPSPELTAFVIVVSIAVAAATALNCLIAIALIRSKSVSVPVRVPLLNVLVATVFAAVLFLLTIIFSVTFAWSTPEPSLIVCHFALWLYYVTMQAKIFGLVVFAAMVFVTVTCGTRKVGAKWLICILVASWVIAIPIHFDYFVPPFDKFAQYVGGVVCYPASGNLKQLPIRLTLSFIGLVIGCILPLAVCICLPLVALCYIKCHSTSEGTQHKKAMAKFASFLITADVLNVLSQIVPTIVVIAIGLASSAEVAVYPTYSILALSYIPTPIVIVVFLKPVRKQLRHFFCRKFKKDSVTIAMQQEEPPE